jgi:nucleoid-associated protein YgaU
MLPRGAIYWAAGLGVTAAVGAAGTVWRYVGPLPHDVASPQSIASAPAIPDSPTPAAPAAPSAPVPVANAPAATAPAPQQQAHAEIAAPAPKLVEPPVEKNPQRPQFDIVRVEPTGEAVIAGHAAPKAKIAITDQGRVIAEANADDTGQFAVLPPTLAPGGHKLGLTASVDGAKAIEAEGSVPVDVPMPTKTAGTSKMASVASAPVDVPKAPPPAVAPQPSAAAPPPKAPETLVAARGDVGITAAQTHAPHVIVSGVSVEDAGRLVVTGAASAGAFLHLYLNGAFLASVVAGADGRWSLTVQHGMTGGAYAVRADEIDRAKDAVISRAEVPFNYPERLASQAGDQKPPAPPAAASPSPAPGANQEPPKAAAPSPAPSAQPTAAAPKVAPAPAAPSAAQTAAVATTPASPANAIVRDVDTTKVVRGDSLWRISTQHYGNGVRYKQIYAANATQIRNPRWIYPGQIFVLPQPTPF